MIEEFERHLRGTNLSENTISSYLFALRQYSSQYDGITKKNLRAYKVWLIENYKPKTVNLRLRAINCYLESIGKESWKMPFVRVQQKAFLENVISEADYEYFKNRLKRDDELFWYFVIRFLAASFLPAGILLPPNTAAIVPRRHQHQFSGISNGSSSSIRRSTPSNFS